MREIYGFLRLANPFVHPSQVLVLHVDLRVRLARALCANFDLEYNRLNFQGNTILKSPVYRQRPAGNLNKRGMRNAGHIPRE